MQYRYISDTHVYIRYTCIFKKPTQNNKTPVVRKKTHLVYYHYLFFIECESYIKTYFAMY